MNQYRSYVVSYDLGSRRYSALISEIKRSAGWSATVESTWLVRTQETAERLYSRLAGVVDLDQDRILVIELPRNPARQGWLSRSTWEWMRNELDD